MHVEKNKPLLIDYTKLIMYFFHINVMEFVNGTYQYTIMEITFSIHGFLKIAPAPYED